MAVGGVSKEVKIMLAQVKAEHGKMANFSLSSVLKLMDLFPFFKLVKSLSKSLVLSSY